MVDASMEVQSQKVKEFNKAKPTDGKDTSPMNGDWFSGTLKSITIQGTVSNPKGGGTATVAGNGSLKDSTFSVSIPVTFTDWEVNDLTINGTVTLTFELTKDGGIASTTILTQVNLKDSSISSKL